MTADPHAELSARLDRIESAQAIAQLPSRYAMALDARDLDALVGLFAPDVAAGDEGSGRDALKRWYDNVLRRLPEHSPDLRAPVRVRRRRPGNRIGALPGRA